MSDELGEREREVLRAIVQEYISSGGPVGSSQLAQRPEFDVSAATMRNVMADLEDLGYLEKPHTSAGRIPTSRGYRFYVDSLIRLRDPAPREREVIEQNVNAQGSADSAVADASRVLHFITQHAGVVVTPRPSSLAIQRVEFIRLRENRVLAVIVGPGGQVHNKPITLDFALTSEDLIHASNYLNELVLKSPEATLEELRGVLLKEMQAEKAQYDLLFQKTLKLGFAATDVSTQERVLIEGAGSFLERPEFADVDKARALFRALEEKHKLLALLDRVQRAREMQIFIGAESDFSNEGEVSVIASPYGTGEQVLGAVGVIGPTRMNYQKVIPLVNFTAHVLSRVLGQD